KESLNVTFDETPPPSKKSPLVNDDLDEEDAIKIVKKKNLENDIVDETLEIDKIVNIKESRNHPLENVIGNLNQRTFRSQAQNQRTTWVFKNKLDENGIVSQNEARLVAQGYNQQEGVDYYETYALVARHESIRILLAYYCALDFKLFQMDVKSAFLNGFINEKVYVAQPLGFINFEKPDHVYKLKKALYGLKQAPKAWNNRDAHLDYLRHLKESVETIRNIVEEAKVLRPLDSLIVYACRVNRCTDASRSQPRSNTKKNRISLAKGVNKMQVEEQPRTNKSHLRTTNRVDSSSRPKHTVVQIVLWYLDSGCSKHMTGDRSRLMNFMKKFIGIVRFGNDHFGAIMGYGDYVIGDSVISRHRRLNHLNFGTINDLARKDLVRGLPRLKFKKDHLFSACQLGKSKKHTHKPKTENTNLEVLNTLYMDLCGPMRVQTINGKKYILVIVDDYSRFTWVKIFRSKDETLKVIIKFLQQIQACLNKTLRYIRIDNGTKFVNKALTEYYERVGIFHQKTVPRTPQQNEVVGRQNRTLVEAVQTKLIFTKAPMFLWAEVVATACYTQNRSLIDTRHNKTPYELVHNKKPNLTFFSVFGALCYPTNDNEDLGKLQPTTDIGIFVGYAPSMKGYRIYNKRTRRIMETIHVQFDELAEPIAPMHLGTGPALILLTLGQISWLPMFDEYLEPHRVERPVSPALAVQVPVNSASTPSSTTIDQDAPSLSISPSSLALQSPSLHQGVTVESILMKDNPVAPIDNNPFINVFAPKPSSDASSSGDVSSTESTYVSQTLHHLSKWSKDHPLDNVIGNPCRPISTRKQLANDAFCDVLKNKARLVAKGYRQEEGIDFEESFAPVARIKAIRIFITNATSSSGMKFRMDSCNPVDTPMVDQLKLDEDPLGIPVDQTQFCSMVGSLMYLTSSIPDLVFAVCMCARLSARGYICQSITKRAVRISTLASWYEEYVSDNTETSSRRRKGVMDGPPISFGVQVKSSSNLDTMADVNVNAPANQAPTMAPPTHKKNLAQHTHGKKKATLIVILSIRFTKLIIYYLQSNHKFYPRLDSSLHLPNEEPVLGYLKFSAREPNEKSLGCLFLINLSLLTFKTGDMVMFMDWFCKRQRITELTPQDLEGPSFELVKVFHPNVIHLQYQMEECYTLLTDSVDDSIIRHNVRKPLPLGGPPGQVTIQSEFFFNKDLEYLRYASKGSRPTLSISRMKEAYYPDVGLEIEVFSMYGYDYMKKIVLRRADLNEHIIAERDFKYLYPSDFENLYLLNLQGHLNHLPPKDKKILTTAVNLWTRHLMIMRFNEIHKFSDDTLHQINEALDYQVKEFKEMVSVTIQQDTSSIPPMTTPIIDLTSRSDSLNAIKAPLRNHFRDLQEADMKEILHQQMWETNSYKAHEDHMMLYEALEKSMNRDHTDELLKDLAEAHKKKKKRRNSLKTPHGSPPHQPPPPPPPAGPSGTSRYPGASRSSKVPPPPLPPPSNNQEGQSHGSTAPSSSKTAA
nr:hypothetical protein [Tanacetum cinerariifolium]